jgi:hypothetical protein
VRRASSSALDVADRPTKGLAESLWLQQARQGRGVDRAMETGDRRLRSRIDERQMIEVNVAVDVLNRMLELDRPNYVRIV